MNFLCRFKRFAIYFWRDVLKDILKVFGGFITLSFGFWLLGFLVEKGLNLFGGTLLGALNNVENPTLADRFFGEYCFLMVMGIATVVSLLLLLCFLEKPIKVVVDIWNKTKTETIEND
jgi:hypothetical protein